MRFLEKLLITVLIVLLALLGVVILSPSAASYLNEKLTELEEKAEPVEERVKSIDFRGSGGNNQDIQKSEEYVSSGTDIYYRMLDETEQDLYGQFYECALQLDASFQVGEDVNADQVQEAFLAMYYDHPELFWLDNTYSYQYDVSNGNVLTITPSYNETVNDIDAAKAAFSNAAGQILSGAAQYETDYEKEKYVHDALVEMGEYDLNADMNQSAYSLLVNHRTVCAGYARSFQYLMNALGIDAYYVVGTSEGQDHAWNIVRIDGSYYNVDVTWDDAASQVDPYYFFDLDDAEFNTYHERSGLSIYLPECTSNAYSHLEDGNIYAWYHFEPAGE